MDVGDKRIGVAVSDLLMITAQGVESYTRKTEEEDIEYLHRLAIEYKVYRIVCGLPLNMNGTLGEQAQKTKLFAENLQEAIGCPVDYYDERLTTASARRTLIEADVRRSDRRKIVDKLAAVYILQAYMDTNKSERIYTE